MFNYSSRLSLVVYLNTNMAFVFIVFVKCNHIVSIEYVVNVETLFLFFLGLSASLGFKKPVGERLFRGYKELCAHTDRLAEISHVIFVVHGVGQVVDDSSIIRNTNIMRDNMSQTLGIIRNCFLFSRKNSFYLFQKDIQIVFSSSNYSQTLSKISNGDRSTG